MSEETIPEADGPEPVNVEDIDGSFVPRPVSDVARVELDGEIVLGVRADGGLQTHCLNQIAGIVWECFDGTAKLDELIDDLSDAFKAPRDVVAEDVLALTRQLGLVGLLEGVAPPVYDWTPPEGLPLGTDLPPAEVFDLGGAPASLEGLRGQPVLLINWSPHCGYCARIAPDLAELHPDLRRHGVQLVLVALGTAEENQELLAANGLDCAVFLQDGDVGAFHGLGTPAAYLVDKAGKIASPLALGADQVPILVREAAGHGDGSGPEVASAGSA
jgi:thiol-disulfide isomerase/thioredoxin